MYTANQTTKKAMTMRENHKEALFDFIRSKEHAGPALMVVFESLSGIKKYFELCIESKPRVSYFPWTHTEIQDDEPYVPLQFMICHRESKQKRLDNGKWKMENGGLANSAT